MAVWVCMLYLASSYVIGTLPIVINHAVICRQYTILETIGDGIKSSVELYRIRHVYCSIYLLLD